MLKQRIITGLILFIAALLLVFFVPPLAFSMVLGVIVLGAGWEWLNLCQIKQKQYKILYLILLALGVYTINFVPLLPMLAVVVLFWVVALVLICSYPSTSRLLENKVLKLAIGFIVLLPTWVAVVTIKASVNGAWTLLFMFALIWSADIGAYFSGRWWGKHKLMPAVSPGKTWEGFFGGLLFSLLIAEVGMSSMQIEFENWWLMLLLVFFLNIFSVTGDLFESMLKRQVGLKDSGHLLPGHGGLLDRIDSLTAAAPIFLFGLLLHWYY